MRVIGGLENIVDDQNHIPLIVGEEKRIPFDVSDAGPGKILIPYFNILFWIIY